MLLLLAIALLSTLSNADACTGCCAYIKSLPTSTTRILRGCSGGFIPSEIEKLTALTYLNLQNNQLTGTIPDSISTLTALTALSLQNNQLTGTIPDSISALTALTRLYLSDNQLTGTIPDSISALTALIVLHLGSNQLTGTIPDSISALTALTRLYLYRNQLTGTIPDSISALTALKYLYLANNDFCVSTNIQNFLGSRRYNDARQSKYAACTQSPTTEANVCIGFLEPVKSSECPPFGPLGEFHGNNEDYNENSSVAWRRGQENPDYDMGYPNCGGSGSVDKLAEGEYCECDPGVGNSGCDYTINNCYSETFHPNPYDIYVKRCTPAVTFTEIGVGNCRKRIKFIGKPETFKEAQEMFFSEPACEIEGATLQYSSYSSSWGAYCCKPGSKFDSNTNWKQYSISGLTGKESALVDFLNELLDRLNV